MNLYWSLFYLSQTLIAHFKTLIAIFEEFLFIIPAFLGFERILWKQIKQIKFLDETHTFRNFCRCYVATRLNSFYFDKLYQKLENLDIHEQISEGFILNTLQKIRKKNTDNFALVGFSQMYKSFKSFLPLRI